MRPNGSDLLKAGPSKHTELMACWMSADKNRPWQMEGKRERERETLGGEGWENKLISYILCSIFFMFPSDVILYNKTQFISLTEARSLMTLSSRKWHHFGGKTAAQTSSIAGFCLLRQISLMISMTEKLGWLVNIHCHCENNDVVIKMKYIQSFFLKMQS